MFQALQVCSLVDEEESVQLQLLLALAVRACRLALGSAC
jgi:hypothetical protein